MARRGGSRRAARARLELDVVNQANPTPEQRARFAYFEDTVANPAGAVVTVTTRQVDGQAVTERVVHQHTACRRQPPYVTLHNRKGICDRTFAVLDWYDRRWALASKGLTQDSLAKALEARGGGAGYCPTDAATEARSDVAWAKSYILDTAALGVFINVMEREMSISQIGGGHGAGKERASLLFKLAANWMLLGVGHRVLEAR